ncbi:phosphohydrolase [Priestia aryabhattai]|uniref:HD domain-containing protein n=1 Tax=Priestia TaxID=2800373 RepID=UPI001C8D171D|nr:MULTISPECIES: HD domain-containing protein [Priestia]MBY0006817.1 bifunctional (p)ppGpp synthetase/guanosine-3',5'-bis(diphosphate) 3'-pyrophosphohydrolase [Priestia aryabhattai]MBY0048321.1 bifunctional (p)ppGpp synthetase/guanosine-3',5'-bis(diphosphate) 3'-pyrophosphohydrolase [Priestia aryabhattai]MED3952121.1 HD domain-containing protein [Priestia aryabhattai]WDC90781.1 HD domain-containing protein [Priestia megaterium]
MSLIKEARRYAEHAHTGQVRKLSDKPYIVHPINVGNILEKAGFSEKVIAAAYLHDAVEDTSVTLEEIVQRFGLEVAEIVEAHTEDKSKSWEERKQHTIQIVKTGSFEVKSLIVADKLDNLRSLKESYDQQGDTIWNSFKRGFEKQKWYYESISKYAEKGLEPSQIPSFFNTYKQEVNDFFRS